MRISIVCSDPGHPVNAHVDAWVARHRATHEIALVRRAEDLPGGELLLLISCTELIGAAARACYAHTLVIHASDLPRGRGWSPHVWRIVEGAEELTLTLLEAADAVDSGAIWGQETLAVPRTAVAREIAALLFAAEVRLMDLAVDLIERDDVAPRPQDPDVAPSYYRRRTPEDSRIDADRPLAEQFDLLRICDPERYPAFVEHRGRRYRLILDVDDE